jgi:hypothetical protein
MLCPFLKIEGVICDLVILAADIYADVCGPIIQNYESSERDRIPICISSPFFGRFIVGDGREEAILVQVIQGSVSHSFRDHVKFQTGHRGIN